MGSEAKGTGRFLGSWAHNLRPTPRSKDNGSRRALLDGLHRPGSAGNVEGSNRIQR